MKLNRVLQVGAALTLVVLLPLAAQQDGAGTSSPPHLARLLVGQPADKAGDLAGTLINEAIRLDDELAGIRRRVVITTSVLVTGVSGEAQDVQAAVAGALMRAAGPDYEALVAATISLITDDLVPGAKPALEAALNAVPEARMDTVTRAAEHPGRELGLRLRWAARGNCRDTLELMESWAEAEMTREAAVTGETMIEEDLSASLPTTTTTTTSTTTTTTSSSTSSSSSSTSSSTSSSSTTTTTRPSPTPWRRF